MKRGVDARPVEVPRPTWERLKLIRDARPPGARPSLHALARTLLARAVSSEIEIIQGGRR